MVDNIFAKRESMVLYALAVIFMVAHHLGNFPHRIELIHMGFNYYLNDYLLLNFSRMCVGLYAFITGYGLASVWNNTFRDYTFKEIYIQQWKRIKIFYKKFWFVFIIFIPYGILKGVFSIDLKHLLLSFIGKDNSLNKEWWYVWTYVKLLLLCPLMYKFSEYIYCNRKKFLLARCLRIEHIVIIIIVIATLFFHFNYLIGLCFLGIVLSRFNIFNKLYIKFRGFNSLTKSIGAYIGIVLLMIEKNYSFTHKIFDTEDGIILVPLFIFFVCVVIHNLNCGGYIVRGLEKMGAYSMLIWLIHTFFCYYYWQKYVLISKYFFPVFIFVFLLSFVSAYVLNKLYYWILK